MRRVALTCTFLALMAAPGATAQMASTRFFNLVDTPATITYNSSGQGQVQLDPTTGSIVTVSGYRKVSVRVGSTSATSMMINMGKIGGTTLSQTFTRSLSVSRIQTFDVVGPEMVLLLTGGRPNTTEQVQLWVWLTS